MSGSLGMLSLRSSKEFCSWLEEKEAAWGRRARWEGSTSQAWEDANRKSSLSRAPGVRTRYPVCALLSPLPAFPARPRPREDRGRNSWPPVSP